MVDGGWWGSMVDGGWWWWMAMVDHVTMQLRPYKLCNLYVCVFTMYMRVFTIIMLPCEIHISP
jgi:hypothetical protein